MNVKVVIVGAGPAGLVDVGLLNRYSIPNIVLEREDCCASLWKKRSYDRLKLHLAKQFCQLPHMPYPPSFPTFVPRDQFIHYLDEYSERFGVRPCYRRDVESAHFDGTSGRWRITARDLSTGAREEYTAEFLVVATGENSEGVLPDVKGLDEYRGEVMHSSNYENGRRFRSKDVLVVGCGNSGMEIAYDLSNYLARTSMVARNPVHVFTKELIFLGMLLLRYLPINVVDFIVIFLSKLIYGRFSQKGEIKVYPSIKLIKGKKVVFENGDASEFDAIIFATGYKTNVRKWLKGGDDLFNDEGSPSIPDQWKGKNGLYGAGFAKKGLAGISRDASSIANDINSALRFTGKLSAGVVDINR
ncbi:hypothetical protein MLD38_000443 [Melastoma candidum]|uniref:Uncharacterized protein n=1 Tax=Melastoma candidum TaxID=119954 RepID=A0ACB9S9W0_9MYRT|nr:hypothetical protein MLD38_000443 [Melastoma candidum]